MKDWSESLRKAKESLVADLQGTDCATIIETALRELPALRELHDSAKIEEK